MVRRYADTVEVRSAAEAAVDGTPSTFLWRGRLYVVREVLGHWHERVAWWTGSAARAVHGEGVGPGYHPVPSRERRAALDREREVWRVEASQGRDFGRGVYDLCHDRSGPDGDQGAWQLLRVAD
jgi:hypothetical protein